MKRLPQFCAAACLTLALSLNAFAGEIGCPYTPPPPPPPPVQPEAAVACASGETLAQELLDILQNILPLV
jgi:hypothetical protein